MIDVWFSIGSNIEPRFKYISHAKNLLSEICRIEKISKVFETKPWGMPEGTPPFLNLAIKGVIEHELSPLDLLNKCKTIETSLGRKHNVQKSRTIESRTIDIDIILFDDVILKTDKLTIPHPSCHKRAFVVIPILSTGEDPYHPILKKRFSELLREIEKEEISGVIETSLKIC